VLQKISGLGKVSFYKSIKKLTELGYMNKCKFQGGIHWIINEIPSPNRGSKISASPEFRNPENTTPEIMNTEISTTEPRTLINNNTPAKSANALPAEEEVEIEGINNERGNRIKSDFSLALVSDISDGITTSSTSDLVTNDLDYILQHSETFKMMYDNAKWYELNISTYSNIFIAYAVKCKLEGNPTDSITDNRIYIMLTYLTKCSSKVDGSELWYRFLEECNGSEYLIKKLID
jgi:hypothetical protein